MLAVHTQSRYSLTVISSSQDKVAIGVWLYCVSSISSCVYQLSCGGGVPEIGDMEYMCCPFRGPPIRFP